MAENFVVKECLTDAMIEAGARMTQELIDKGEPLVAAFWLWDPDQNDDWRLVFSATYPTYRPLFQKIRLVRDEMDEKTKELLMFAVTQESPDSELVRALRETYPTGANVPRKRIKGMVWGKSASKYVHDALLYLAL